jgi:hypothetical protein
MRPRFDRSTVVRATALSVAIGAVAPSAAAADPPKIIGASVEPNDRRLVIVTFDPAVPPSTVLSALSWTVVLTTKTAIRDAQVQRVGIVTCSTTVYDILVARCPKGESAVEIAAQMAAPAPTDLTKLEVRYQGSTGAVSFVADLTVPRSPGAFVGAASDDADVGFTGTWTKTQDEDGLFTIDAFAGYMRARVHANQAGRATYLGRIGFYGQAKTNESKAVAPDSFLVYGVYQREFAAGGFHGLFQAPVVNVRAPGWEFDRKGEQRNFVVSPVLTVPVRWFVPGKLGVLEPGLTVPHGTLQIGAEVVKPLEAKFGNKDWRVRGLVGGTFLTGYAPESPWINSIQFSASYLVRFLSDPEVFKDPRRAPIDPATGKRGDAVFELGSCARPHAEAEFTYRPAKWIGVSVKYEFGSEPPVFVVTNHTVTVGLSFALKQTSYGRYAILKP